MRQEPLDAADQLPLLGARLHFGAVGFRKIILRAPCQPADRIARTASEVGADPRAVVCGVVEECRLVAAREIAPGGDVGGIPGGNPSGNPGDGYSATTTGTALAAESRQVARTVRTTALVSLRLQRHELDLPILGVGVLALAAWGAAADRLSPEQVAEGWGLALRLHSRQDFGPTRHQAVREQLLRRIARDSGTGAEAEAMLDAAATAHVGDTADAGVAAARAWLESLRP